MRRAVSYEKSTRRTSDVTVGATERDPCMTLRDVLVQYYSVLFVTRCEPVGADFTRDF
jgi:hypothetical protein